jgi:tetratricopeptide (TPR) repeat protein
MTQIFDRSPDSGQVSEESLKPSPTPATCPPDEDGLAATLGTKDSLGAALTKQGKYDEAATLLREVLTTRETLGQSANSTGMLRTMNNLGAALSHQGNFAAAEALHRQVLQCDEQNLSSDHPHILIDLHNLASVLTRQDKLDEAAMLQQRALELSRKACGPRSPKTLRAMGNVVDILLRQEKYEQAELMATEVLTLRREVLRAHHPEIAAAMHSLAAVLSKRAEVEVDDANEMRRQELAQQSETDMEKASSNDGELMMEEGMYKEAERIFRNRLVTSTG